MDQQQHERVTPSAKIPHNLNLYILSQSCISYICCVRNHHNTRTSTWISTYYKAPQLHPKQNHKPIHFAVSPSFLFLSTVTGGWQIFESEGIFYRRSSLYEEAISPIWRGKRCLNLYMQKFPSQLRSQCVHKVASVQVAWVPCTSGHLGKTSAPSRGLYPRSWEVDLGISTGHQLDGKISLLSWSYTSTDCKGSVEQTQP